MLYLVICKLGGAGHLMCGGKRYHQEQCARVWVCAGHRRIETETPCCDLTPSLGQELT